MQQGKWSWGKKLWHSESYKPSQRFFSILHLWYIFDCYSKPYSIWYSSDWPLALTFLTSSAVMGSPCWSMAPSATRMMFRRWPIDRSCEGGRRIDEVMKGCEEWGGDGTIFLFYWQNKFGLHWFTLCSIALLLTLCCFVLQYSYFYFSSNTLSVLQTVKVHATKWVSLNLFQIFMIL